MEVLELIDSSSDESTEEINIRRRQKVYRPRINFNEFHENEFKERFRLRPFEAQDVLEKIGHKLPISNKNMALSPNQQLLVALHWLGNGGQYHGVGDMHGISKSTVCRVVKRVVHSIVDEMFQTEVHWPVNSENIATEFMRKGGFPNVAGCADGTQITIDSPTRNEASYVNRYGDHSLNSLMICGPDYRFYFVSANMPGSVHDSRVMKKSTIFRRFEEGWRPFPEAVILGDSGYGLRDWLIPPLRRNPDEDAEINFNRAHVRTRRIIENAFGILKERFPCLKHLRVKPTFAGRIIMACSTLHNVTTVDDFQPPINENIELLEDDDIIHPNLEPNERITRLINFFR